MKLPQSAKQSVEGLMREHTALYRHYDVKAVQDACVRSLGYCLTYWSTLDSIVKLRKEKGIDFFYSLSGEDIAYINSREG